MITEGSSVRMKKTKTTPDADQRRRGCGEKQAVSLNDSGNSCLGVTS